MKSAALTVVLLLALAAPSFAQLQAGNITGTVGDEQGGVLPSVVVALTSDERALSFSTDASGQFRFLNLPPGTYTLTFSLPGFTTLVREGIVVTVGATTDLPIILSVAAVEETVTVTGESPVIDARSVGTATNFTQDELARIPNSRDPWALLRTVPGVQVDRINIAGNETGQQSGFVAKGSRREDAVWTLDGIQITDMSAVGASPTYFDYDAFDEIQISTGGQDIRQPTGGVGLNFVVKRGTNQVRGTARGYFTNDRLEAVNLPDELRQRGVTPETADHNDQIADYGFDLGGPIVRDRAWIWGSWTKQDIRLIRQAGTLDKTVLETWNVKGNWQATEQDMVSFLWFNGDKIKLGRLTGTEQVAAPTSTWNQSNNYPDNPFKGLWKLQNDRVFTSSLFASAKYAYYGTGFQLAPQGGLDLQAGRNRVLGETYGSWQGLFFLRPQHIFNVDANYFQTGLGGTHDIKFGFGWRRTDAFTQTLWPGNMILADIVSATDHRAWVYREGAGTNRTRYLNFYVGDTFQRGAMTLDLGLRYDRQSGSALPSSTRSNAGLPNVVPGIQFDGYDAPFTWNNLTPRAGVTYALDDGRKTLARVSFARYAGQLDAGTVGYMNPSALVGVAEYRWVDLNGDGFAQPNEVLLDEFLSAGGGFNPANPTAVTSANQIDPNLKAAMTTGLIFGIDREVAPNLAASVNYSYGRTTDHWGAFVDTGGYTPLIGFTAADYFLTSTTPEGIAIYTPDPVKADAVGNGRFLTNRPDYHTTYHGIEVSVFKRMADGWMGRAAVAWNNPREFYTGAVPLNNLGNPTRTDTAPLVSGGQVAPRSAGSGQGDVFINGKWSVNINGAYQLPYDMEVAGNLFGKQGTPFPHQRTVSLGRDGARRVLVSDGVDSQRFESLWNLDLRWAKNFRQDRLRGQFVADLFNVFNSNSELNRQRNVASPNFQVLTANLSPRILRFGVRFGF